MSYKIGYENTSPYDEKRLLQFALYVEETIKLGGNPGFNNNDFFSEFYEFGYSVGFDHYILKDLIQKVFFSLKKLKDVNYFSHPVEIFYLVGKSNLNELFDDVLSIIFNEYKIIDYTEFNYDIIHIRFTPLSYFLCGLTIDVCTEVIEEIYKNYVIGPFEWYSIIYTQDLNVLYKTVPSKHIPLKNEYENMFLMIQHFSQKKYLRGLSFIISYVIHFLPNKKEYILGIILSYKDISNYALACYYKNHLIINGDNTYYIEKLTQLAQDKIHGYYAQEALIEYDYDIKYDKDKYASQILSETILKHFGEYPSETSIVDKRSIQLFKTDEEKIQVYIFRYKIRSKGYVNYGVVIDGNPYIAKNILLNVSYYEIYNVTITYYLKETQDYKNDYSLLQENIISNNNCKFLNAFRFLRISDAGDALFTIGIITSFLLNFLLGIYLFFFGEGIDNFNLVYLILSGSYLLGLWGAFKYKLIFSQIFIPLGVIIVAQLLLTNTFILGTVIFLQFAILAILIGLLVILKREYIFLRYICELKKVFKNDIPIVNYNKTFYPQGEGKPLFQIEFNVFEKLIIGDISQSKFFALDLIEYEDKIFSSLNLSYGLFLLYEKAIGEEGFLKRYIILGNKILHHPKTPDCIKEIIKNKLQYIEEFNKERME